MVQLAGMSSKYLLVYNNLPPFFSPYAVYLLKKLSHLSCRISPIVHLADCILVVVLEGLVWVSDTSPPCVTVNA